MLSLLRTRSVRLHLGLLLAPFAPAAESRCSTLLGGVLTLDESWAKLLPPQEVARKLEEWEIMDSKLGWKELKVLGEVL